MTTTEAGTKLTLHGDAGQLIERADGVGGAAVVEAAVRRCHGVDGEGVARRPAAAGVSSVRVLSCLCSLT